MRSRLHRPLLTLIALTFASLFLLACATASAHAPAKDADKHLIECGGPMAAKVAERASTLALEHATTDEASRQQLEQLIVAELKVLAVDYAPELLQCLVDKALSAHRQPLALQQRHRLIAPSRELPRTACSGFVPLERDPGTARPWHTLLAGARGVRS